MPPTVTPDKHTLPMIELNTGGEKGRQDSLTPCSEQQLTANVAVAIAIGLHLIGYLAQ